MRPLRNPAKSRTGSPLPFIRAHAVRCYRTRFVDCQQHIRNAGQFLPHFSQCHTSAQPASGPSPPACVSSGAVAGAAAVSTGARGGGAGSAAVSREEGAQADIARKKIETAVRATRK